MKKVRKLLAIFGIGVFLMTSLVPAATAYAATEPTYELTDDTADAEAYVGVIKVESFLNVRTGYGSEYEQIMINGEGLVLHGNLITAMQNKTFSVYHNLFIFRTVTGTDI